jgi:hypothetical protein
VDRLRQVENLPRHVEQLLVLLLLLLDELPLVVGQDLSLRVRAVLADHHERRQEDRLERDGERQRRPRVLLERHHPHRKHPDMDVHEHHRAREGRDLVGDPVLHVLGPFARMRAERVVCRRTRDRADGHGSSSSSASGRSIAPALSERHA